jgi:uncharacterized protein YecE (DUF72 family)
MRIHIGTSGYNYPEWRGTFYPAELASSKMFGFYSQRFRTVEINYTFYRMPTPKTTKGWHDQAPPGFLYTLKAPRQLTHDRRLVNCEEPLARFVDAARGLGAHLGTLLFQLPPNFRCDVGKLSAFLAAMPKDVRPAFEFRHDSWLTEEIYALLRSHGTALCIADFGDKTTPLQATARHGYFRLRDEGYQKADLETWAGRVLDRAADWDDAFVYFKHEEQGKGPEFAKLFGEILTSRGAPPA